MLRLTIVLLALSLLPRAHAAEGRDSCTGMITSLPATISTPGIWCLGNHVATAITSGVAISVEADDVTIDCNDFKVGGLAGSVNTNTVGIGGTDRLNTTVRNCVVRGFIEGIRLAGTSAGAVIENNRLDFNTVAGISLAGSSHLVRNNRIFDTGGRPASLRSDGIVSTADFSRIEDNSILRMQVAGDDGDVVAVTSLGNACEIARNNVSGLFADDTGEAVGIDTGASVGSSIHRNQLLSRVLVTGTAILAGADNQCGNNSYAGWTSGIVGCSDAGNNVGN